MLEIDYDLLEPEVVRSPYALYAELREAGPVHWSPYLGGWVLTRHADVLAHFAEPRLSAARYDNQSARHGAPGGDPDLARFYGSLATWFTFADPPLHTRLRRLVSSVLVPRMKQVEGEIDGRVDVLMAGLADRDEIDVVADLSYPLSLGVIGALIGVPDTLLEQLGRLSAVLEDFIGGALNDPDRRASAMRALVEVDTALEALIEERLRAPRPDLLTDLAQSVERGEFTLAELRATIAMLVFAGHGTTTHLIGNGVLALLRHPVAAAGLAGGTVAGTAVEELLRYDSPVQITVRIATESFELAGAPVEAGQRVFGLLGAGNRDDRAFPAPDELRLDRRPNRHLSFGYGIHFCIGAPLSRREAPPLLRAVMAREPQLAVAEADLAWQPTIGYRKLTRLPVALTAR